jgi:hypothetical protein
MAGKFVKKIVVAIFSTTSGSTRFSHVEFDVAAYPPSSLWHGTLKGLAKKGELAPLSSSHIFAHRRTFDFLSIESQEALKLAPNDFTRDSLQQLLRDMDLEIGGIDSWSDSTKFTAASRWRCFLCTCPGTLGDGSAISHTLDGYHTPLKKISPGRALPKSRFGRTFSGDLISTIAHESPEELLSKAKQQVHERLDAITRACKKEFELYEEICKYQQKCLAIDVPAAEQAHILAIIKGEKSVGTHKNDRWYSYDDEWIAAVALAYINSKQQFKIMESGAYDQLILPSPKTVYTLLHFYHYQFASSCQPWFFARHRLPNKVITAMFIFLLERTSWNPGSLGRMTTDGIKRDGGNLTLQGFKQKTDDDTPTYEVPRNDLWVRKIIVMLERNREQLIAHNIIPASQKLIWFGWQAGGYTDVMNHVHQLAIKNFCNKYELSYFAPSELRPMTAASIYLEKQDLRAVQILLGHSSLNDIESYLNDTLLFHLNEAKALQFQREIEATLIFATRGQSGMLSMKIEERFINEGLLFPTGDGGTCKDPLSPPYQVNKGDICDGLHCHANGGCSNYKLQVDASMLELAVRTKEFYRLSWERIFHRNESTFKRLHIPRIIFIHVLLKVVAEKRPALLKRAISQFFNGGGI